MCMINLINCKLREQEALVRFFLHCEATFHFGALLTNGLSECTCGLISPVEIFMLISLNKRFVKKQVQTLGRLVGLWVCTLFHRPTAYAKISYSVRL
jgi:hypothetical protein